MASSCLRVALAQSPVWDGLDGGACIIACSGGRDSVALACATAELLHSSEFTKRFVSPPVLALWHLDHGLRSDSASDAEFVIQLAEKLNASCIVERAELSQAGGNTEAAARQERYHRLIRLLVEPIPSDGLPLPRRALTAHHLGDQAETVLHHLVRGTHLSGLRAISPVYKQLVFRPWLHEPPEIIAQYLAESDQDWREDSTNSDLSLTRNRLRFNIIPELRLINPRAREHIARLADIARDVHAVVDEQVQQLHVESVPAVGLMPWLPLLAAPRGRYFTHYLESGWTHSSILAEYSSRQLAPRLPAMTAADYERVAVWAMEPADGLSLHGVKLRVHQHRMLTIAFPVEPRDYNVAIGLILNQSLRQGRLEICFNSTEETVWYDYHATARRPWEFIRDWPDFLISRARQAAHSASWCCFLPAHVRLPLILRNWQAGDTISLPGGGTKKLGDIFTDAKVPEHFRACWSVLLDADGQVLWVPGLADSALMGIESGQSPTYCVRLTSSE